MLAVQARNLKQRYGRTEILHGIDLDLGTGVIGLLGPNGAGKTTLLKTLATILKPASGDLQLLGNNPLKLKERRMLRRRLGYLPQAFGYYPNFTVSEFVEYFALLKEMPRADIRPAVRRAIEQVGLVEKAGSKLRSLSGGMLRRVGIAQAIVNKPDLLLLDEPTAGLDLEQRVQFRQILREIGMDATVIVSTHLIEDVGAACSEVALLGSGRILFTGTPVELIHSDDGRGIGDSPLERGYSAIFSGMRA